MKVLFALAIAVATMSAAQAATVANDGSCAAAQATYAKYGRVYVRASGHVVPVYGLAASCPVGFDAQAYWIRTNDTATCVLGNSCYRHTGNN